MFMTKHGQHFFVAGFSLAALLNAVWEEARGMPRDRARSGTRRMRVGCMGIEEFSV
jgi:hypothetical protein